MVHIIAFKIALSKLLIVFSLLAVPYSSHDACMKGLHLMERQLKADFPKGYDFHCQLVDAEGAGA